MRGLATSATTPGGWLVTVAVLAVFVLFWELESLLGLARRAPRSGRSPASVVLT